MRHLQRVKYFVVLHTADGVVATVPIIATSAFEAEQEAVEQFRSSANTQEKIRVMKVFTK